MLELSWSTLMLKDGHDKGGPEMSTKCFSPQTPVAVLSTWSKETKMWKAFLRCSFFRGGGFLCNQLFIFSSYSFLASALKAGVPHSLATR